MKIRLNARLPVAMFCAGFAGIVVAVALASAGDAAPASASYESTVPTGPTPVCGSRPTLLVDGATFTAGEPAGIEGCNWYANLGCTEPVDVTLKAQAVDYAVGQLSPHPPHIHVEGSYGWPDGLTITGGVSFSVGADGKITIPESANLTTNAIRATMSGTQKLSFRLPVVGCIDLLRKRSRSFDILVNPTRPDSSVVTQVSPANGSSIFQGQPLKLAWTLGRAGEVRIHLNYLAGDTLIPVATGAEPDVILDQPRPAGANTFTYALAGPEGDSFPAGKYQIRIELRDPRGSQLVPARPKDVTITVGYAR